MCLGLVAIGAWVFAATATPQTTPAAEQGQYAGQLRAMFAAVAGGRCPANLMAEELFNACQSELPRMTPSLKAAGPIKSLTFLQTEEANGERYEQYQVTFTNGSPSKWTIGGLTNGKFRSVYSIGY